MAWMNRPVLADMIRLNITEEDGSPSTFPYKVKFTNGTVTDNGDGTTSISSGGGGLTVGGAISGGTDTRVLFDDAATLGEDSGFLFVKSTDQLTLGENGQDGSLKIYAEDGATDHSTIFQPGTQVTDITYTLPTGDNLISGNVLVINTSGVLQWEPRSGTGGSGTPSAPVNSIQFNSAGTFSGSANLTFDGTSQTTVSGSILLSKEADKGTPASNLNTLYAKGDGKPYFKNDSGTEYDLSAKPTKEFWWPASATEPLEAVSDAIPPLSKFTGTNVDILTASYDDTALEGRKVCLKVPNEADSTKTVTFRIYWFSRTATTGNVIWNLATTGTGTSGESWDQALTQNFSVASAVQGTTNQMSITTITRSFTALGWAANDYITLELLRQGSNVLDTMVGDAEVAGFSCEIPLI